MLGSMFAIRGHKGLKRMVISNSPASMPLWVESCNEWRKQLPEDVEKALQKHEKDQTYDDPQCKSTCGACIFLPLKILQTNGPSKNSVSVLNPLPSTERRTFRLPESLS